MNRAFWKCYPVPNSNVIKDTIKKGDRGFIVIEKFVASEHKLYDLYLINSEETPLKYVAESKILVKENIKNK